MTDIVDLLLAPFGRLTRAMRADAACEIEALRAENARLREALKPFADMAAQWKPGIMFLPMPDEHSVLVEYIYLRKASEALNDPR